MTGPYGPVCRASGNDAGIFHARKRGAGNQPLLAKDEGDHRLDLGRGLADGAGNLTERIVWPVALGYFEETRMLVAWCEWRQGYRHFRTDRMRALSLLDQRYPQRRAMLLKAWREAEMEPRRQGRPTGESAPDANSQP